MHRVLLVDDDRALLASLARVLEMHGFQIVTFDNPVHALEHLVQNPRVFDAAVCDVSMPQMSGLELVRQAGEVAPTLPIIMLTADNSAETAVDALRSGAFDYLTKPLVDFEKVLLAIGRAARHGELHRRAARLEAQLAEAGMYQKLVGRSRAMQELFTQVDKLASSEVNVLILGESGTGKELVARAIHARSNRAKEPCVALNCAALPDTLVDSELFGHARGAFTGAVSAHEGAFERANNGSLFLDEIGDISSTVQVRLLRVLQEREVMRIGGSKPVPVNVRVLAATHVDLEAAVGDRRFREDLYYRLNVVSVRIPPLRERKDDIPLLAAHFLQRHGESSERAIPRWEDAALQRLSSYSWPGNVRELENVVQRALALCDGPTLSAELLPTHVQSGGEPSRDIAVDDDEPGDSLPFAEARKLAQRNFERGYITRVLRRTRGNLSEAARRSGMDRSNFRRIVARLEIDVEDYR